ncbi:hypothetical protein Goklo_022820, partial [Gossypium klotzschianum]|nr:hypothetical protein [Gossypium klotzschianum]
MLPTVDFAMGANNSGSTSGIRRATKRVHTKPKIQLMDLENNLYLVHFQDESDYNKVAWIRLPGLPKSYYSDCLLRLTICVDLRKQLVSKVRINGRLQLVEYEVLPNICFQCGMYGYAVDVCPGITTAPPVEESGCTRLVMEKSSLEKNVEDEPYGSWMVVERQRGRSQDSSEVRNDGFMGLARGSRFVALGVSKGEVFAVFNSEVNESDEVVTMKKANGDGDMGLGFPEKNIIETKGKQAKLRAKGKKVVMGNGPKLALKVLKPNNGSLGMNLNIGRGAFDDGSRLAQVGATNRGKAIVKEKVEILTNLIKEKHAAIHILEKEKMGVNIDKEN